MVTKATEPSLPFDLNGTITVSGRATFPMGRSAFGFAPVAAPSAFDCPPSAAPSAFAVARVEPCTFDPSPTYVASSRSARLGFPDF